MLACTHLLLARMYSFLRSPKQHCHIVGNWSISKDVLLQRGLYGQPVRRLQPLAKLGVRNYSVRSLLAIRWNRAALAELVHPRDIRIRVVAHSC